MFLGVIGLITISFAIWIKNEKRQNLLFAAGGACLLVYSISIENVIFSVLQLVFVTSALVEIAKKKK